MCLYLIFHYLSCLYTNHNYQQFLLYKKRLRNNQTESYSNLKEEYFEGYCNDTIGLSLEEHLQIKLLIIKFI